MIHHVIIDNPRQWHKIIPFTVWAIREVPNATTGVTPYMLVYGRLPRGPLAVLKERWTGDINLPSRLGLQPKKYLQKMKENLEKAVVYANKHSKVKQLQYTNQYNEKDKHKAEWMTRPRVFVRCLSGKRMDCYANHNCVNLMHKHDLILYVFYISEPFNLCCDSNDCAGETVLAM